MDGLSETSQKKLCDVVRKSLKEAREINSDAVVQCVMGCRSAPRLRQGGCQEVILEKLNEEEQKGVLKKWMARFGKENVSDPLVCP